MDTADSTVHDADAPLVRERSYLWARELGDDWREEEPGIYRRYVGHHRPEYDLDRHPSTNRDEQLRAR
jgi:hypothetical protein